MMAARELAGFTMSEADILRAAMGKKDKAKMGKLRTKFIDGTVERGIAKSTAEALFDGIAKFAEYGFNRAHSAPSSPRPPTTAPSAPAPPGT